MVGEDVVLPWNVGDLESGLRHATDEALALHLVLDFGFCGSLVCEGIDNDTEEDVHQDNVDNHEEREVEDVSCYVQVVVPGGLSQHIADATTCSEPIVNGCRQTHLQSIAVHVESWGVVIVISLFVVLKVVSEALEGNEGADVQKNTKQSQCGDKRNLVFIEDAQDLVKGLDLVNDINQEKSVEQLS